MKDFIHTLILVYLTASTLSAQDSPVDFFFKDDLENALSKNNWSISKDANTWQFITKSKFKSDSYKFYIPIEGNQGDSTWLFIDGNQYESAINKAIDSRAIIKCAAVNAKSIFLSFNSLYRKGDTDYVYVEVSSDSSIWEPIELYADLNPYEFPNRRQSPYKITNPEKIILDLTNYIENKNQFWISFRYVKDKGNFGFGWQIDNIEIVEDNPTPKCDIAIPDNYYAIAQNLITPYSQIEAIPLAANIENRGLGNLADVKYEVNIYDATLNSLLFHDEKKIKTVNRGDTLETILFDNYFTPQKNIKKYVGEYKISTNSCVDEVPKNNIARFKFELSDSIFQKENGVTLATCPYFEPLEMQKWEWGNFFYVTDATGLLANSITFGYSATVSLDGTETIDDSQIKVKLFKYSEDIVDEKISSKYELTLLAESKPYLLRSEIGSELLTLSFQPKPKLEDNTLYFAVVEYIPTMLENSVWLYANDTMFYQTNYQATKEAGFERFSAAIKTGNDTDYDIVNLDYPMVPVIRLNVSYISAANDDIENNINTVNIFPNPVNNTLYIDDSAQLTPKNIKITDSNGRIINQQNNTSAIDVSQLPKGNYQLLYYDKSNNKKAFKFIKL